MDQKQCNMFSVNIMVQIYRKLHYPVQIFSEIKSMTESRQVKQQRPVEHAR